MTTARKCLLCKAVLPAAQPKRSVYCGACAAKDDPATRAAKAAAQAAKLDRIAKSSARTAKLFAEKRGSPDAASYAARREEAVRNREPCRRCGKPFNRRTHQIDHVTPLALGKLLGLLDVDDPSNLQVLCKRCHREKSAEDMTLIAKVKRDLKAAQSAEQRR